MRNNIAIYVSSFDGYSDVWDIFFKIFYTYWADCKYNIYLVNNEKQYTRYPNVNLINTGPEVNWFFRTMQSLMQIKEEYIMFFLEDYFISKKVSNDEVDNIVTYMAENNKFYYRLSKAGNSKNLLVNPKKQYLISLQPAIWKRDCFLSILDEINGETPWDFEYYFNKTTFDPYKYYYGIVYDNRDILGYKNGILRGKWFPNIVKFYKKQGINIDISHRQIMTTASFLRYIIVSKLSRILSQTSKSKIKIVLDKLGIKYI